MSPMAGVAVDIVSGFLGSGKTTLLRHVLTHGLSHRRVAVIMNEIGDVGIDGKVITGLEAKAILAVVVREPGDLPKVQYHVRRAIPELAQVL